MEREKIKEILQKYSEGRCSEEEKTWIETWYNGFENQDTVDLSDEELEQTLLEIYASLPRQAKPSQIRLWSRIAAAAVLIVALYIGFHFYVVNRTPEMAMQSDTSVETDIVPGGDKAILTLADGSTISLNEASAGELVKQQGLIISKTEDGQIIYKTSVSSQEKEKPSSPTFNKISTPRGGQYQIILPDGTRVWLNAASSLEYPTAFTGNERKVALIGEAYFEVASLTENKKHNTGKRIPFVVSTATQLVRVLGTHFNIQAYEDEPSTKTTLLEGSVSVVPVLANQIDSDKARLLKPGEQAIHYPNHNINVEKINTANAIAWKSGLFQFQGSDIKSVMRELSRWYDVEIEFEGPIPDIKLWGEVYRNVNASRALEILEYFNLKYRIEQRKGTKKIIIS